MAVATIQVVDAYGCDPDALRSAARLAAVFEAVVRDVGLHPIGEARWETFPGEGGVTGYLLLSESHLAVHTYPEHGYAAFDLHCCRENPQWDWTAGLARHLGADRVEVRRMARGAGVADPAPGAAAPRGGVPLAGGLPL